MIIIITIIIDCAKADGILGVPVITEVIRNYRVIRYFWYIRIYNTAVNRPGSYIIMLLILRTWYIAYLFSLRPTRTQHIDKMHIYVKLLFMTVE